MNNNDSEDERKEKVKIQDTIPLRTIGIETERENLDFQHRPPHRYAHRWFAPRPTPASRAAILASVLPSSIEDDQMLEWMGVQPSNKPKDKSVSEHVREKRQTKDDRSGSEYEHYGYRKIWRFSPDECDLKEIHEKVEDIWNRRPRILDATAGGGTIPLESLRYNFPTEANELNPIPSVILKALLEYTRTDTNLSDDIEKWAEKIDDNSQEDLKEFFPERDGERIQSYLWSHRVVCPDCGLKVPLSSNWWLERGSSSREGIAAKPVIDSEDDKISFEIVELPKDIAKEDFNPTEGTISYGKMNCPRCNVTMDSTELKSEMREGNFDYQLYAIWYGKYNKDGMEFRKPGSEDLKAFNRSQEHIRSSPDLFDQLSIDIPSGEATKQLRRSGMNEWRDLFTSRQLLTHLTYLENFKEVKKEIKEEYPEEEAKAIITYLTLISEKALDYNSRMSTWEADQPMINATFAGSDFAFSWSFQEHNLIVDDHGYDWIIDNIVGVYEGVREQLENSNSDAEVYQADAANLPIGSNSIDAIVLDPPYYGMIMYAELSDFFYVWMKKYLQDEFPDFFTKELTNKDEEAVANPSNFEDLDSDKSKKQLAREQYENKMTEIFKELNRVISEDGVFTMMFTHKETEAWDTLTKALIEAGFTVTATHPVNTENKHRVQQKGKNSADSTILLTSEKRKEDEKSKTLWKDVKEKTKEVARREAKKLDKNSSEIAKLDVILSAFGPTLEVFTNNYPVVDSEGEEIEPERALDTARDAVSNYLIDRYLNEGVKNVDPVSEWYILSWLIFEANRFPYDEARRLALGVGKDIDKLKTENRLWRKKSGDIVLRHHEDRVRDITKDKSDRKSKKPVDPEAVSFDSSLDKVHAAMHVYKMDGERDANNWLSERSFASDPGFKATLKSLLKVLPRDHDDWKNARDLASGKTGEYLDIDLNADIFKDNRTRIRDSKLGDHT